MGCLQVTADNSIPAISYCYTTAKRALPPKKHIQHPLPHYLYTAISYKTVTFMCFLKLLREGGLSCYIPSARDSGWQPAGFISCCKHAEKGWPDLPTQIGSDFLQEGVGGVAEASDFHSSCDYYQLLSSTNLGLCGMLGKRRKPFAPQSFPFIPQAGAKVNEEADTHNGLSEQRNVFGVAGRITTSG